MQKERRLGKKKVEGKSLCMAVSITLQRGLGCPQSCPHRRGRAREHRWGERQGGRAYCSVLSMGALLLLPKFSCPKAAGMTLALEIITFSVAVTPPPAPWNCPPLQCLLDPGLKISPAEWSLDFSPSGCGHMDRRQLPPRTPPRGQPRGAGPLRISLGMGGALRLPDFSTPSWHPCIPQAGTRLKGLALFKARF